MKTTIAISIITAAIAGSAHAGTWKTQIPGATGVAMSADGSTVYVHNSNGRTFVRRADTGGRIGEINAIVPVPGTIAGGLMTITANGAGGTDLILYDMRYVPKGRQVASSIDSNGLAYTATATAADGAGNLYTAGTVYQAKLPTAGRIEKRSSFGIVATADIDLAIIGIAGNTSEGLFIYGRNVQGGGLEVLALNADLSTKWRQNIRGAYVPGMTHIAAGDAVYVTAPAGMGNGIIRIPLDGGPAVTIAQTSKPKAMAAGPTGVTVIDNDTIIGITK